MHYIKLDDYNDYNIVQVSKPENKKWQKYDSAFNEKSGTCYIDNNGNFFSYQDLYDLLEDDEAVEALYKDLDGNSPEEEMETDWHFSKCKRCGNWVYSRNVGFFHYDDPVCRRCTPLKTNGIINVWKDPYDDDRKMYSKTKAKFKPGVTVLVGCNGIGKSTLISNIKDKLKSRGTPYLSFDNLGEEGGQQSSRNMLSQVLHGLKPDPATEKFATLENAVTQMFCMSEGEKIRAALIQFTHKIVAEMKKYSGYGEFWIMFDAIDSGLSYDVICDIKRYIFGTIIESAPENIDVYIIVSCNSYEMLEGSAAFSVEKMKYVNITTYHGFTKAVLSSVEYKQKRDHIFDIKAEIWGREYKFTYIDDICDKYNSRITKSLPETICASMELAGYRIDLLAKASRHNRSKRYIMKDSDGNVIPIRNIDFDGFGSIRKDNVEKTMHDIICGKILKDEFKKNY